MTASLSSGLPYVPPPGPFSGAAIVDAVLARVPERNPDAVTLTAPRTVGRIEIAFTSVRPLTPGQREALTERLPGFRPANSTGAVHRRTADGRYSCKFHAHPASTDVLTETLCVLNAVAELVPGSVVTALTVDVG